MTPDVPRLAWPLRLVGGRFATVEQDSDDDIAQCIKAIVQTSPGERADLPDMGLADPVFEEQPLDVDALREMVARHEPRAAITATATTDPIDTALAELGIEWGLSADHDQGD